MQKTLPTCPATPGRPDASEDKESSIPVIRAYRHILRAMPLLAFWRRRKKQDYHALLYVMAASAWLAACNQDGDHAG